MGGMLDADSVTFGHLHIVLPTGVTPAPACTPARPIPQPSRTAFGTREPRARPTYSASYVLAPPKAAAIPDAMA